ncbi:unnamed protein product [Paramecium sonneborni]|nr:unnamed protein product [Paramecium sonneborni]
MWECLDKVKDCLDILTIQSQIINLQIIFQYLFVPNNCGQRVYEKLKLFLILFFYQKNHYFPTNQHQLLSNEIKELVAGIFKPFLPEVIEFLVGKILMQDIRIVNALIFSGILEVLLVILGAFYYIMVETPNQYKRA